MTQVEKTHLRSKAFSGWLRENLPDSSTGTLITDIDFAITNYKKNDRILFIEEKTNGKEAKAWQRGVIQDIVKCINKSGDMVAEYAEVTFEHYNFDDGRVWLNGSESNEEEIKSFINRYC